MTNAWFAVGVGAASGGGTGTVTYCTSKGTSVAYEFIDYVAVGTLARTSGADAGYYNGTALTAPSLTAGVSQTFTVSAGFAGTAYSEYVKMYIDYNKNGVFTDAGELVINAAASSATTNRAFAFTIPTTAKNGTTRMRVVLSDASATTSCGSYSYGETEDYTVSITGGTALTGAAVASLTGNTGSTAVRTLTVYPNPATEALNVALGDNADIASVMVTDLRGAQIKGLTFSNGTLNISTLAKGMYTLSVSDGQKVFHQRFVKE